VIDLHLHTTASDGALAPADLVRRASAAGLTVISITDHDTIAGLAPADAAAGANRLEIVPGIEITAIADGRDIHVLGYYIDPASASLDRFLVRQRADRVRRVSAMAERLADLGCAIDAAPMLADAARGRSVGRPQLAAALVRAGHVHTQDEAFVRFLEFGRAAFVPRAGASPADVVTLVHEAGGLASLAHPGLSGRDDLIPGLVDAGLDAIEVRHADHDEATEARYREIARRHGIAVTGGSDFHADDRTPHHPALGAITLPREDFERLRARRLSA
jgi:3',5'-nucleoside bisphosphate phosphatase